MQFLGTVLVKSFVTSILFCLLSATALAQAECVPPNQSLIGWWPGEGNADDVSGTNHGTELGGLSYVSGKVGQAFSFDGIDDMVEIADVDELDLASGEYTIEFWMKPNSCSVSCGDAIPYITKESATQFDSYATGLNCIAFVSVTSASTGGWSTVVNGGSCVTGIWHHIVVTQAMSPSPSAKMYVDGTLVSTDLSPGVPYNSTLPLLFGHRSDVSSGGGLQPRFFDGLLDEIAIYGSALSEAEVQAIFDAGAEGKCQEADTPVLLCESFYPPMANHPVKAKKNRAFPLKMEIFDANGFEIEGDGLIAPPVVQVLFAPASGDPAVDVSDDALSSGQGTEGNQFVFTDDGIWQFNLKSKNYTAEGEYLVTAVSGDEDEYIIDPACVTSFRVD